MTAGGDRPRRLSTGDALTALAEAAIDSAAARRIRRTSIVSALRATGPVDRARRALRFRYVMQTLAPELAAQPRVTETALMRTPAGLPVTPFVLLGQGRTGSNLVQTELNRRWPEIRCLGEEYKSRAQGEPRLETVEEITARVYTAADECPVVGCRVFYDHVTADEYRDIVRIPGMKVVHLRRRNLLRRYVSLQIAMHNEVWMQSRRHAPLAIEDRAVTIDVDHFIQHTTLAAERRIQLEREMAAAGVPVLEVWYEDVSARLDAELRRIAAFLGLGVPVSESPPTMVRQNPEPLRLLVRNYGMVRRRLQFTSMREFLDPEDASRRSRLWPSGQRKRTCWPTPDQELLLRAALLPPAEIREPFAQWRNTANPDEIDQGSRRLYPLLYRNLRRAGAQTSFDTVLRGEYVSASGRNQKLLRTLEHIVGQLDDADVPVLVLKGAALTVLHYRDRGTRPMSDLDVLVPRQSAARALDVLQADGWYHKQPESNRPIEQLRLRHAVTLQRGDDEVDIHWAALAACIDADLDAEFWDASVDLVVGAQRARALAPPDQLLHAFVHGVRFNKFPPLRWIADAHMVISTTSDLDWDRLLRLSTRYRLAAYTRAALTYLDGLFPTIVPPSVLVAAQALPVSRQERHEFNRTLHTEHWLPDYWNRYRRSTPDRGALVAAVGFVDVLRTLYEADHAWQLPARAAAGITRRRLSDGNGTR